jgi:hypothetical protein
MMKKQKYSPNDVAAGRAFASAYVEYTHYVERLYDAAETWRRNTWRRRRRPTRIEGPARSATTYDA